MKLYSMRDIAEEVGKDKSNVYRYIKKHNIAHADVKERAMLFNATQKDSIVKGMTGKSTSNVAQRAQHNQNNEDKSQKANDTSQVIAAMQANIENLKEQNALLVKQLESKDKQLNEAQKLIDQQQQLNLSTQSLLTQQNELPKGKQQKQSSQESNEQTQQPEKNNDYQKKATKKSFFKHLFYN